MSKSAENDPKRRKNAGMSKRLIMIKTVGIDNNGKMPTISQNAQNAIICQ
jgi:hypothetical protein